MFITPERHIRWYPVIDMILADINVPRTCPFCGSSAVHVSWSVFHQEPRTASFDISCKNCGERMHCALFMPKNTPDVHTEREGNGEDGNGDAARASAHFG